MAIVLFEKMKRTRQRNIGTVIAVVGLLAIPAMLMFLRTIDAWSAMVRTADAVSHSGATAIAGVVAGIGLGIVVASFMKTTDE